MPDSIISVARRKSRVCNRPFLILHNWSPQWNASGSPADRLLLMCRPRHRTPSVWEAAENAREGQKSYPAVRGAEMLKRAFLNVPDTEFLTRS